MKIRTLFRTLAFGAAVSLSLTAYTPLDAAEHHHEGMSDALFAKKAAAGGMTEVELGKIAQQNGDSQDVKDFGAKMVTDHSKMNDQLKDVATKDKLMIPDHPMKEQQAMIDKLGKMTGKQFDSAYIHTMLKAHMMDKELFAHEAADGKNPDLQQLAKDGGQVIQEHLTMIQGIASSHGVTAGGNRHHHMKADSTAAGGAMATPAANATGDASQSKSGVGPGATGNPAPAATTSGADSSAAAPASTPSTSDASQSKSGVGPGGTGNPAPQPQL